MTKILFLPAVFLLLIMSPYLTFGQESYDSQQPERLFEEALKHYRNERYGAARAIFEDVKNKFAPGQSNLRAEAAYYVALSASKLENEDAEDLLEAFLIDFPESGMRPYVYKRLGDMDYEKEKYRRALQDYRDVEARKLNEEARYDFRFRYGYCLFMEEEYDKALSAFSEVRQSRSQWRSSANYYYAYIHYLQENYQSALAVFRELEEDPGFADEVPYYIAQIYYLQQEYQKAIDYGSPLIEEAKSSRKADMARVVGNAWFAVEDYEKAVRFLSMAVDNAENPRREDYYHLGIAHYRQKEFQKASQALSKVTGEDDAMAQNAYYHLGNCHLHLNDKKRARVAFEAASQYDYDESLTEDAMFNYIKLNYELSFSPFNEIIDSFMEFIDRFPESRYIDDAWEYLGQALLTSRNYQEALEALEKVKDKTAENYRALQRIAYHRGLELFNNLRFKDAVEMLDYSLQYGDYDQSMKVKAYYWLGEAHYRKGDFNQAIEYYDRFIRTPGSYQLDVFRTAHYNLGYAWFKKKNYQEAASWFRKYENLMNGRQSPMLGDALSRIGDAFYIQRDFQRAIQYYERATNVPGAAADYAMYQKAFAMGIEKNHEGKIDQLQELIDRHPESSYVDDAYYEIGRSYVALNDLKSAIRMYKTLKEEYPRSNFAKKAMLQLGLLYYNDNNLDKSLAFYERVVNEFPGTPEAEDALLGIKNIYMDRNDADGYIAYTKQVGGFASIDERQEDSLSYVTAEKLYMKDKCLQAINQFESYLRKYPNGRFAINAHFYKADCQYRNGDYEGARRSFEKVASTPGNDFMDEALLGVADISYRQERYDDALAYYKRLEEEASHKEDRRQGILGQMRCFEHLEGRNSEVLEVTRKVLASEKLSADIEREARYLKAKAHLEQDDTEQAFREFQVLKDNTSSSEGAEARYRVAQILFDRGEWDQSEQEIFDFVDAGTPHQYWIARSFLLLADIYKKRQEFFQARQYLESLLENYQDRDDDIHELAQQRLEELKSAQNTTD